MSNIIRAMIALPLIILAALAEDSSLISPRELPSVLSAGDHVRIGTNAKKIVDGIVADVTVEKISVRQDNQIAEIPLADIDWFRVRTSEGNKRTWLPLILCSVIGTTALVAAGATEERKSTYLPLAGALTVGVGVGGYYAGRSMDYNEKTYRLRKEGQP